MYKNLAVIVRCLLLVGCGSSKELTVDSVKEYFKTTEYEYQVYEENDILYMELVADWDEAKMKKDNHVAMRKILNDLSSLKETEESPEYIIMSISNGKGAFVMANLSTDMLGDIGWNKITSTADLDSYINTTCKYY